MSTTPTTMIDYGSLLLGSRLRRLSDQLHAGVDQAYLAAGVSLSSRCFPVLFLLRDNGPTSITVLAAQIGQTHPAVVQLGRKMLAAGVVAEMSAPDDERRRLLALTDDGRQLMLRLQPVWQDIQAAVDVVCDQGADQLLAVLSRAESHLQANAFADMIAARKRVREREAVEIIDFAAADGKAHGTDYADDFKRLNIEWLERHFYVEALDHAILSQPRTAILAPGGAIFLARLNGAIVGTCALINSGDGKLELSKMAVTQDCQGLGLGRRLIERALAHFRASGASLLFLESNSKLQPALALYESVGFRHVARPETEAHYQRANVYMEFQP